MRVRNGAGRKAGHRGWLGFLQALLMSWVLACGVPASAKAAPVVVVTSKPVHSLVAAVMVGVASPALLVDGAASPHSYALRPSQARELQTANVFVRVSSEVEPFSDDLVRTLPQSARVLTLADMPGVSTLPLRTGAAFAEAAHDHRHGHDDGPDHGHGSEHAQGHGEPESAEGARDGHIWLDPENAKAIALSVAAVLAEVDPGNGTRYRENAAALAQRIDSLDQEIAAQMAPVKHKTFVVLHDATQYFETRYGLHAAGAIQLSPLVPPSAARLTAIRARIRELKAACVFSEPWLKSRIIDSAIEGTQARVATIDPEAIDLTSGPDLYFVLMRNLAAHMAECLGA